jgi:hypothetical protein
MMQSAEDHWHCIPPLIQASTCVSHSCRPPGTRSRAWGVAAGGTLPRVMAHKMSRSSVR